MYDYIQLQSMMMMMMMNGIYLDTQLILYSYCVRTKKNEKRENKNTR